VSWSGVEGEGIGGRGSGSRVLLPLAFLPFTAVADGELRDLMASLMGEREESEGGARAATHPAGLA
jgi:hypothetical protein